MIENLNRFMTNTITTMRRHMALFEEGEVQKVSVRVGGYVDPHGTITDAEPVPQKFYFEYARDLDRDTITAAIKADILAATGYEPTKFKWRPLS